MTPERSTDGFRRALGRRLWGLSRPLLAALALSGILLGGILWLGQRTRQRVHDLDRYAVPFAQIDCPPPPGQDRARFLAEVRYVADEPERLSLLDEDLAARLAQAFARHPWVEHVERVEIVPPRQVRVRLTYRVPVLAVVRKSESALALMRAGAAPGHLIGVVDGNAVRLPAEACTPALPELASDRDAPVPAGARWHDPAVEATARTAAFLYPYQDRLHIAAFRWSGEGVGLTTREGMRVIWGRPPRAERSGEALADQKLARLLHLCQTPPRSLDPGIITDLRPSVPPKP